MGLLLKCTYSKGVHAVAQYHFTLCPYYLDLPLRFVCSYYTVGCYVSCTDIGASWDTVGSQGDKLQCDMDCGNQKVKLVSSSAVTRCWTYSSCYLSQCVHNNNNLSYLSFIVVYYGIFITDFNPGILRIKAPSCLSCFPL